MDKTLPLAQGHATISDIAYYDVNFIGYGTSTAETYEQMKRRHQGLNYLFYDGHAQGIEWESFFPQRSDIINRTIMWP